MVASAVVQAKGRIVTGSLTLLGSYCGTFVVAEFVTAYVSLLSGAIIHCCLVFVSCHHGGLITRHRRSGKGSEIVLGAQLGDFLLFVPLLSITRIAGIALPLEPFPKAVWPGMVALPLLVGFCTAMSISSRTRTDVGLRLSKPMPEALVALAGVPLGMIGFVLLHPRPTVTGGGSALIVAAGLTAGLGALEEILFRGMIQHTLVSLCGVACGVSLTQAVFVATMVSERSLAYLGFVAVVSLAFGVWVYRSRSVIGVAVAHGLTAAGTFVVWPHLL